MSPSSITQVRICNLNLLFCKSVNFYRYTLNSLSRTGLRSRMSPVIFNIHTHFNVTLPHILKSSLLWLLSYDPPKVVIPAPIPRILRCFHLTFWHILLVLSYQTDLRFPLLAKSPLYSVITVDELFPFMIFNR